MILMALLGVLAWSTPGTAANTMTFDAATYLAHPPYSEAGMTVTTVDNYGWEPTFFNKLPSGPGFGLHMEGGIIKFDMGGDLFDLDTLYYDVLDGSSNNTVTFSNGGTHTFNGGGWADDLTVDLTGVAVAKSIQWFTITLPDIMYCSQLDYVTFTPAATIPAPASVLLVYAGLAAVTILKRRRRL
jgi:hypothetical protein